MPKPLFFSIVIPAYNEEFYLESCLSSLAKLNYDSNKYEVIVVDNGSTDGTLKVVKKYRVRSVSFPEGDTISSVRNKGASVAEGNMLAFLDADCIVSRDWLLNAAGSFNEKIGVVGSKPTAPSYNSTWVQRSRGRMLSRTKEGPMFVSWLSTQNFIVKKRLFDKVGGFNEALETCEDVDISCRLNKITKILFNPTVEVFHLREPRTLYELFKKEIWHGKSAYKGILSHGLRKDELLSTLVPFFYLINIFSSLLAFVYANNNILSGTFFVFLFVPIMVTSRNVFRTRQFPRVLQFFLIDLTYLLARSFSVIYSLQDLLRIKKRCL